MKNLIINIATVNGTGSLSANQLLTKMLFRAGWRLGAYSFFPSNIAGLPCLYSLRISEKGWTGFSIPANILISLNPKSLQDDLNDLKPGGLLIGDEKDKLEKTIKKPLVSNKTTTQSHVQIWPIPFSSSLKNISPKIRPLLKNMIYVGLFCEWFQLEKSLIEQSLKDFFSIEKQSSAFKNNQQALNIGRDLASAYKIPFPIPKKTLAGGNFQKKPNFKFKEENKTATDKQNQASSDKILIDGNTCMALGALSAGCQFLSWYPITPATSLAENFEKLANTYQRDEKGQKKFVVLQSEDELASIAQAIGAGWAGLRAMTATSGPGLSLMSEGAGLSYFAEIPLVLCNVQRAGPSTGLPTRTHQGDLLSSAFLSHGDCRHIVLLPGTPEEAFYLTAQAFDLAEELQTLVIVLSDLDLGMNLRLSQTFQNNPRPLKRGKLLKGTDLAKTKFLYEDPKGDGISPRFLPGIHYPKEAHLDRGSGHNKKAEYSERPEDYSWKLNKLKRKWENAKKLMPEPIIESSSKQSLAFVTFGPNEAVVQELRHLLKDKGLKSNFIRIRSFPFPKRVESFLKEQSEIFVVEQNRGGQLKQLLSAEFPKSAPKMKSLLQYDGRPLTICHIQKQFEKIYQR